MTNSDLTLVLGGTGKTGRVYEVTRPRALTFAEVGYLLTAAGRPVEYVPVTVDGFVAGAVGAGVPAEVAAPLGELLATVLDGRNAEPADGVAEALGRASSGFAAFAATAWGTR